MIFLETPLPGVIVIELEPSVDERGSFARTYCVYEMHARGLDVGIVQAGISTNKRRGTLRGLHYQVDRFAEAKVVTCVEGAIHDVVVDVRRGARTFGRSIAIQLDAASRRAIYVPKGFAHGFQTLADETVVSYQMTAPYNPEAARGVRWDDPSLGIAWPIRDPILSARDRALPFLQEAAA